MEKIKVSRGDLFYAEIGEKDYIDTDNKKSKNRPVVIIYNDLENECNSSVIVAPIIDKVELENKLLTHIPIRSQYKGLRENSIILAEQIMVLNKESINFYIGRLSNAELQALDRVLIIPLELNLYNLKLEGLNGEFEEQKLELLTRKQIISYAMLAREHLKHLGNLEFSNEEYGKYILTLMNLYSPIEIEEQAEKIKRKKQKNSN